MCFASRTPSSPSLAHPARNASGGAGGAATLGAGGLLDGTQPACEGMLASVGALQGWGVGG